MIPKTRAGSHIQDMRALESSTDPRAAQAIARFAGRIRREIGAMSCELSADHARVRVFRIPTDMDAMIARDVNGILTARRRSDAARRCAMGRLKARIGTRSGTS
jgi:acetate kinase